MVKCGDYIAIKVLFGKKNNKGEKKMQYIFRDENNDDVIYIGKEEILNFGEALEIIKNGGKAKRKGWNGKNQYIELATNISYVNAENETINVEHNAIGNKAIAFVGTSGVQLGWLASQSDMLAEDWMIVK